MDTGRRRILQGLTGVGASLVIGCGSGGVDNFAGNFGAANLSDSPGGPSSAPIGGSPVSGRANLAELGGTNVSMGSILQAQAGIAGTGDFQLNVSPDRPLIVFATDDSKVVRGLAVSIPGRPLLVDAQSTALALIFMTAGLSSSDPAETGQRLDAWAVHSGFAALVSSLRNLLPAAGLAGAVKDAGVQAALAAIILSVTPKMFLAKDQPFTYEEMLLKQPAGLRAIYKSEQPAISISFGLQNIGFRFVSVVRQRRTVRGDIVDTLGSAHSSGQAACGDLCRVVRQRSGQAQSQEGQRDEHRRGVGRKAHWQMGEVANLDPAMLGRRSRALSTLPQRDEASESAPAAA